MVTTLILYGDFEESSLEYLRLFDRVKTLVLDLPLELRAVYARLHCAYGISPGFLKELCETRPHIWPRLQRLHFAGPFDPNFPIRNLDEQGLIEFVADRNAKVHDIQDRDRRPARIVDVLLDNPGVSSSTREKLAKLTRIH